MNRPRFFTTSLAAAAVAATLTFVAPAATAAPAADQQCGLPGSPAVYETVEHPAVTKVVPAQSHTEWRWELLGNTFEFEFSKLISPETTQVHWSRDLPGATENRYQLKVVTEEYQPATPTIPAKYEDRVIEVPITVTEYLYQLIKPGKDGEPDEVKNTQWEVDGWGGTNGNNPEAQWVRTDETREATIGTEKRTERVLVTPEIPGTPEVPEESHLEYQWSATDPGGDWTPTGESRTAEGSTETVTTDGPMPAGDGWTEVSRDTTPADYDYLWAADEPGNGYAPTGEQRVAGEVTLDQTEGTSAEAPGQGWTKVPGTAVKVVDAPRRVEVVEPSRTEKVLVKEAVPATDDCDQIAAPANGQDGGSDDQVAGPEVAGPQAAPAVTTGVLPNTGSSVSIGIAAAGLGSLAAGAVLMMLSRRNRFGVN